MVSEHFPTEGYVNASYTEEVRRVREVTPLDFDSAEMKFSE